VANQFSSGKDLCTEGEFQLLLYSTRAALPTLAIDGCRKGLTLHHPLKPFHSCNSGNKCNCQNSKSFFAVGVFCRALVKIIVGKAYILQLCCVLADTGYDGVCE